MEQAVAVAARKPKLSPQEFRGRINVLKAIVRAERAAQKAKLEGRSADLLHEVYAGIQHDLVSRVDADQIEQLIIMVAH